MRRRDLLCGLVALGLSYGIAEARTLATGLTGPPAPPAPLAKLTVHNIVAGGPPNVISGPADADLLLVSPPGTMSSYCKVQVRGFRGVWCIGGSYSKAPAGTLVAPNGVTVPGTGALMHIQNHAHAVRPFTYLSDLAIDTTRCAYGDMFQLGGAAWVGAWDCWPDVWMQRLRCAPGALGWGGYWGGTNGHYVSHSDFRKADMGGWRNLYTKDLDVRWGFQMFFDVPSFATNDIDYCGPGGPGQSHFWNTTMRPIHQLAAFPQLGSMGKATAVYLAASGRDHKLFYFHENVRIVPPAGHQAREYFVPQAAAHVNGSAITFDPHYASGTVLIGAGALPAAPRNIRVRNRAELLSFLAAH
jgi:hypothetical protein